MIVIFFSWIVIFIVLFSLGDFFISTYNRISKRKEIYSPFETLLFGLSLVCILLPLSSFWLPSNHYILLFYVLISAGYCIWQRERFARYSLKLYFLIKSLTYFQLLSLLGVVLLFLFHSSYISFSFDSEFYHYQHIRLNEDHVIIPGMANIEDRFGFNSNYLLVSAIFSFRWLSGVSVFPLNSFLFLCLFLSMFIDFYKKEYSLQYLILILIQSIFTISSFSSNTNTDFIPILISFYYLVKIALSPKCYFKQYFFIITIPILLVTFKLSLALFSLIMIPAIISLLKKRNYRVLIFFSCTSTLIIFLWCARNVMLSGYLLYPITDIDIFDVDWKLPKVTAILQSTFIKEWAVLNFSGLEGFSLHFGDFAENRILYIYYLCNWLTYICILPSTLITLCCCLMRKDIDRIIPYAYLISLIGIIFTTFSAPDYRFMAGFILSCLFITCNVINRTFNSFFCLRLPLYIKYIFTAFILVLNFFVIVKWQRFNLFFSNIPYNIEKALLLPIDSMHDIRIASNSQTIPCRLNDEVIVYINDALAVNADSVPFTKSNGIPFNSFDGYKVQSLKTIELRGRTLCNGFRTKVEYKIMLDRDIQKYIDEYRIELAIRVNKK